MASLPIHWIEAHTHAHATEDEARVAKALAFACSEGKVRRESLRGHFGNPIVRLTSKVDEARAVRAAWSRWAAAGLLASLARDVEARVDDGGVLHFRLDKQESFLGSLAPAKNPDSIDLRVRLRAHPATRAEFLRVARALLGGGDPPAPDP